MVRHTLSPAQVLAAMRKDGKPAGKIKHAEDVLRGTGTIYAVSVRKRVKIPPSKAKIFSTPIKNKRSAIFIEGVVDGKKAIGILANVLTSSIGGKTVSRGRSTSRRRSSSGTKRRHRSSSRGRRRSRSR